MATKLSYRNAGNVFLTALKAIDPYVLIRERIANVCAVYRKGQYRKLFLISFGKAAYPMTKALSDFADGLLTTGIMITKYGHVSKSGVPDKIEAFEAAHPIPERQGVMATGMVIALLEKEDREKLVVGLISGGGSALLVAPHKTPPVGGTGDHADAAQSRSRYSRTEYGEKTPIADHA
ncbi:MAG: DUF4147 domain-containing protein [Syntrophales bacterium]